MKKYVMLFGIMLLSLTNMHAQCNQEVKKDSFPEDEIVATFLELGDALSDNDTIHLRSVLKTLKGYNLQINPYIVPKGDISSLNGHFVYDTLYVENIINGSRNNINNDEFYKQQVSKAKEKQNKGRTEDGAYFAETFCVKANGTLTYNFKSHDIQEIKTITGRDGRLSLRIYVKDKNGNIIKTDHDTIDPKIGRRYRIHSLKLPHRPQSLIQLEVINCANNNTSFVLITN